MTSQQPTPDTPTLGEAAFAQYLEHGGEVVDVKPKLPSSPSSASLSSSLSSSASSLVFPSPPRPQSPPELPTKDAMPLPPAPATQPTTPPRALPSSPDASITTTVTASPFSTVPKPRTALFSAMSPRTKAAAPKLSTPASVHANAGSVWPTVWPTVWPAATETAGMHGEFRAPVLSPVGMRPASSSSRHQPFSSLSAARRPIKYGTGKHAEVELVPQPSDGCDDPLNWPVIKKEANYWTLLLFVSLVGVMKTALLTVNSQLATGYGVSYTAATALTGVPLMVSALAGFASLVASRIAGKRVVYLVSTLFLLVGTAWNTSVSHSYAQCMAARVFQGLGWGAFDVLVLSSVDDTFFEHQRYIRHAVYDIVAVASTWGGPLIGGVVANHGGYRREFVILASFVAFAVLALVVAVPETTYDRSFYSINPLALPTSPVSPVSPSTAGTRWSTLEKDLPQRPRAHTWSPQGARDYLGSTILRPVVYTADVSRATLAALLWQVPLAMVAPTTVLLAVVSLLPFCALWGFASSLSLFFAPLPYDLSTTSIGLLLVAPFTMTTAVVSASAYFWPSWHRRSAPCADAASMSCTIGVLAAGTLLTCVSMLAFALYVASCAALSVSAAEALHGSAYTIGAPGMTTLKFPVVSLLVGLLAAGAHYLDATVRPMVRRSTQFTSSNVATAERNTIDMSAAVMLWRTLIIGAFVMALPNAVWLSHMLKATSIGLAVAQVVVAVSVVFIWWRFDEVVRRMDGQIMRCVDLEIVKRPSNAES